MKWQGPVTSAKTPNREKIHGARSQTHDIMSYEDREPDGSDKHRERVREIIDEDRELLNQLE
ncbi:hypothetical protein GCM10009000_104750 [Halobacterium noricense]